MNIMTIQQDEIKNVANIFEAFARAVEKRESIKIEYLNEVGEVENLIIETNKDSPIFSFDHCGLIDIKKHFVSVFRHDVNDIQSVTTFRTTKLKFSETNKK